MAQATSGLTMSRNGARGVAAFGSANLLIGVLTAAFVLAMVLAIWTGNGRAALKVLEWAGPATAAIAAAGIFLIKDRTARGVLLQIITFALIAASAAYLISNTLDNLATRKIATGYGFLEQEARFAIGEHLIDYSAASSYGRALLVGFLNTLKVAIIGIVLATVLGISIGILGLSKNWLVARIVGVYVSFLRNIPILLHIILWYTAVTFLLPGLRESLSPFHGVYLSQRGLYFPVPVAAPGWTAAGIGLLIGIVASYLVARWAKARQDRTGEVFHSFWAGVGLVLGLPFLGWLVFGAPTELSIPEIKGFNFQGGESISPEFMAVLGGLAIYTSAYIAEITRSGILAVPHGQTEAGRSLGLSEGVIMRKVILPQALRVIIPPTTNQYLNLTKNSSLSVAVGYPDLVSVANTTLNQTGQAIEVISIIMLVYLSTSLATSVIMNWYNRRIQLVER